MARFMESRSPALVRGRVANFHLPSATFPPLNLRGAETTGGTTRAR